MVDQENPIKGLFQSMKDMFGSLREYTASGIGNLGIIPLRALGIKYQERKSGKDYPIERKLRGMFTELDTMSARLKQVEDEFWNPIIGDPSKTEEGGGGLRGTVQMIYKELGPYTTEPLATAELRLMDQGQKIVGPEEMPEHGFETDEEIPGNKPLLDHLKEIKDDIQAEYGRDLTPEEMTIIENTKYLHRKMIIKTPLVHRDGGIEKIKAIGYATAKNLPTEIANIIVKISTKQEHLSTIEGNGNRVENLAIRNILSNQFQAILTNLQKFLTKYAELERGQRTLLANLNTKAQDAEAIAKKVQADLSTSRLFPNTYRKHTYNMLKQSVIATTPEHPEGTDLTFGEWYHNEKTEYFPIREGEIVIYRKVILKIGKKLDPSEYLTGEDEYEIILEHDDNFLPKHKEMKLFKFNDFKKVRYKKLFDLAERNKKLDKNEINRTRREKVRGIQLNEFGYSGDNSEENLKKYRLKIYDGYIAVGLDIRGKPLEVDEDDKILLDVFMKSDNREIDQHELENYGYKKVDLKKIIFDVGVEKESNDHIIRKVPNTDICVQEMDSLEKIDWINNAWDGVRDDFRDGRQHPLSKTVYDYTMAAVKQKFYIWKEGGAKKDILRQRFKMRLPVKNKILKKEDIPEYLIGYTAPKQKGEKDRDAEFPVRVPTHLNPAMDLSVDLPATWRHWGRRYYYENVDGTKEGSCNPDPTFSTRGIAHFLIDYIQRIVIYTDGAKEVLEKGPHQYDYGIRRQGAPFVTKPMGGKDDIVTGTVE